MQIGLYRGSSLTLKPGFHLWAPCGGELLTVLITSVLTVIVDNWERLQKLNNGYTQMMDYQLLKLFFEKALKMERESPGSPVVRTLNFHCMGHEFSPWLGS